VANTRYQLGLRFVRLGVSVVDDDPITLLDTVRHLLFIGVCQDDVVLNAFHLEANSPLCLAKRVDLVLR